MDYEQKIKEYLNSDIDVLYKNMLLNLFPELKESDDERIKREITGFIRNAYWTSNRKRFNELVAWLEKQGEDKPVISDDALREGIAHFGITQYQIDNWLKKYVDVEKQGIKTMDCSQNHQDSNHPNGCIVLEDFNGGEGFCKVHLDYLSKKQIEEVEEMVRMWNHEESNTSNDNSNIQQKDFAPKVEPKFKVKYANSEYDVLEIKDIAGVKFYGIEDEPNHIDYVQAENCEIIGGYGIKKNRGSFPNKPIMFSEQNPDWSEEDEEMLQGICDEILANKHDAKEYEWKTYDKFLDWLKSLRPQNTWKPSDEQMQVLSKYAEQNNYDGSVLTALYQDLKKLREE